MSSVLVDSNVLLDVATRDSEWFSWSALALAKAGEISRLVINPIIYGEVSVRYSSPEDMEAVLPGDAFTREPISYEAAFLAGKVFKAYRERGGVRTSILPDFFIGAHAMVAGHLVLTRDARRFRTYFPKLTLITPE